MTEGRLASRLRRTPWVALKTLVSDKDQDPPDIKKQRQLNPYGRPIWGNVLDVGRVAIYPIIALIKKQ